MSNLDHRANSFRRTLLVSIMAMLVCLMASQGPSALGVTAPINQEKETQIGIAQKVLNLSDVITGSEDAATRISAMKELG